MSLCPPGVFCHIRQWCRCRYKHTATLLRPSALDSPRHPRCSTSSQRISRASLPRTTWPWSSASPSCSTSSCPRTKPRSHNTPIVILSKSGGASKACTAAFPHPTKPDIHIPKRAIGKGGSANLPTTHIGLNLRQASILTYDPTRS